MLSMELLDALRTTGAIREFRDEPVDDQTLYRVLDTARFAPSGGNRQGWRVVVVKDPEVRRRVRDLYKPGWHQYVALRTAGLTPWAPVTDRDLEAATLAGLGPAPAAGFGDFVDRLDEVPVLLVLLADLRTLAAIDRDHDRYTFAGGASIYPFAWNLLLAAREEGLGGVITTLAIREEDEVKRLLRVPDDFALAAVIALGRPVRQPHRLRRGPVEEFATVDRFGGAPFDVSH